MSFDLHVCTVACTLTPINKDEGKRGGGEEKFRRQSCKAGTLRLTSGTSCFYHMEPCCPFPSVLLYHLQQGTPTTWHNEATVASAMTSAFPKTGSKKH